MTFRARQLPVACVGTVWFVAAMLCWLSGVFNLRENLREVVFDHVLLLLTPLPVQSPVVVVDIDSDSLARYGPWPWRRLIMADLLQKIAQPKPRVVGLDILLTEPDRLSPAGLARNLGAAVDRDHIAALTGNLPDGDAAIADALGRAPAVVGFALDSAGPRLPQGAPILARGRIDVPGIWRAGGAAAPLPVIAAAARGLGAAVLAGDANGEVRRVPLLVAVGDEVRPGFAAEVLRLNYDASTYIIDAAPQRLHIGPVTAPIDADAALRILPRPSSWWTKRTVPAWKIIDDEMARGQLANRIVLVGSGAPEAGGLRPTPASATTPSVQIQADAVETLTEGDMPRRPSWISGMEIFGVALLCLTAIALATLSRPVTATILVALFCLMWVAGALGAFLWQRFLIDVTGPPAIALVVFGATALGSYAQNERLQRALRRRFEQRLAPDIVKRLVDNPNQLRLGGETRLVTAMFTDIEGFTSLTERSDAGDVMRMLNDYMALVTDIVIAHGGMVDQLMGDGIYVLFNVPLDLTDHERCALAAAEAIIAATENLRKEPLGAKLALGRTRIGIESGTAIVGDIGGGHKLDYTAIGVVVNMASRLQNLNKELGTSICIGPNAAAALPADEIEWLGAVKVRGRSSEMEVFTVAGCGTGRNAPQAASSTSIEKQRRGSSADAI